MTPRRFFRRLFAIARYALKLWKAQSMPLTLDTITESDLRVIQRQADLDGIPLEHWARNQLLKGCSPTAVQYGRPASVAAVDNTLRGMDAVDAIFAAEDGPVDPNRPVVDGDGILFTVPDREPAPEPEPAPAPAPATEVHGRVKGPSLQGPIAATEQVEGHPCRHLHKGTPTNFAATACQGTCKAPSRDGNPCNWAPSFAQGCPYFVGKVKPTPPKSPLPRQG